MRNDPHLQSSPLVYLHQAQVIRGSRTALTDITFALGQGENWMVLGPNGSGKSTFLSLLRGDIWPVVTNRHPPRQFQVHGRWQISPLGWRENTALVSPELEQYLRSLRRSLSCAQVIGSGIPLVRNNAMDKNKVQKMAIKCGLTEVLDQPFALLSQGEAQKTLMARALMAKAQVLFLDESLSGLDQSARQDIVALVHRLQKTGIQIIASTHRPEDWACCTDKVIFLEQGKIAWKGEAHDLPCQVQNQVLPSHYAPSPTRPDRELPCIQLEQAVVSFQGRPVLGPITWTIHSGEHWRIQGPNGSGKTTLLKLLAGEVYPSLGGRITRFPPIHSQTLQGLRQNIGWFSPELTTRHRRSQTGLQTVLSGLRGQFGVRESFSSSEQEQALDRMKSLGLAHLADRDILGLSSGQLRRLLLARTVVHEPRMLLMDEPCAGLDAPSRIKLLQTLENLAAHQVQIVMVSHRPEESFPALNRTLTLDQGRVTDIQNN
ncbi:MAG: ATP-binding cassette domain-containing protein [Desulfovermiculus sp.]|nr:ATP-binding cassette domain-containing protein [Desulfovermiculus sp.]